MDMNADGPASLQIKVCAEGSVRVLVLGGRLAESGGLYLLIAVAVELHAHPRRLVLDLSGLQEAATAGLTGLVMAQRRCRAAGCRLILAGARGQVGKMLALSGLDRVLETAGTVEEALSLP